MKPSLTGVLWLAVLLAGCATSARRPPAVDLGLSEEDELFGEALTHYAQGLLYEGEYYGYANRAFDHFIEAAKLDPSTHMIQAKVALNYLYRGQIDKAVETLEASCKISPNRPQPWVDLATVCHISNRIEPAIAYYRKSIQLAPGRTFLYYELARLLLHKQRDQEAAAALDQGIKKSDDRDFLILYAYTQGRQFVGAGEMMRSLPFFQLVAANVPENKLTPTFYLHRGAAYERAGQMKQSEEVFEKCLQFYPDAHEVLNYLAYMWAEQGINLSKALEYVNRALTSEPNNGAYVDTLGWIYFKQKRYKEALEQIEKANRLIKDDPVVNEHLGDAFFALREKTKAVESWEKSFRLDPNSNTVASKLQAEGVNIDNLRIEAEKIRNAKDLRMDGEHPAEGPKEPAPEMIVP